MFRRLAALAAIVLAVALAGDPARAHTPIPGVGGFSGGLLHPLLVPAHELTLVSLGLLAGQHSLRPRLILLATFAASLLAGLAAIVAAVAVGNAEVVLLACAALAGLLAALARPAPVRIAGPLAAVCGLALALDSVPEEISIEATLLALTGTIVAAPLALACIAAVGALRARRWQRIGVRILASGAAAGAILVLALRLVP